MTICLLPPPVLPRPQPSRVTHPAWSRDNPPYHWSDNGMDEAACRREFAARLKAARAKAGLTQKKLAALSGVSQSTICFLENALRPTNMVDFIAIADGLGVPAASLLPGTPPPAPVVLRVDGPLVCEECDSRQKRRKRRIRPVMRRAR